MKSSSQNLIQEFMAVDFQKNELDFRDMSELKALPLLAYQHSYSDLKIILYIIHMWTVYFRYKAIATDTSMEKKKIGNVEEV